MIRDMFLELQTHRCYLISECSGGANISINRKIKTENLYLSYK